MGRFVCPPTAVLYCTQQHHQTPSNKMKKIITIIIKKSKADASLSPLPVPLYSLYNRMNGLSSRGLVLWKEGKTTYTHTHDTTTTREREERNIIRQAQRNCTYQLKQGKRESERERAEPSVGPVITLPRDLGQQQPRLHSSSEQRTAAILVFIDIYLFTGVVLQQKSKKRELFLHSIDVQPRSIFFMESFIFFFFFLLDSSRTTSSSLFLTTTTTTIIAVCNKTFLILNQLTSSFEHSNGGGSSCCCYIHRYIKIPFGNYQSGFSSLPPFFFAYKDTISSD